MSLSADMPAVNPRRPWDDAEPEGYQESDNDFIANNIDACAWFLENRDAIHAALAVAGN